MCCFSWLFFFTRFIIFDYFWNASHRFCLQFICVSLKTDEPVHLIAGQKYWKCENIRWHMKFSLQAILGRNLNFFYFLEFFSYIFRLLLSVFFFPIFFVFFFQYIRNMCVISIRFLKKMVLFDDFSEDFSLSFTPSWAIGMRIFLNL